MAPLKRDHSRSQDINDKVGYIKTMPSSTAYGHLNKHIPQIIEDFISDEDSDQSKLENEDYKDEKGF